MSSARESSAFPIKTLLIVLGIGGFVVLLVVLVCVGFGYFLLKNVESDFQALQTSGDAFVEDIHTGQLQSAYGRTSSGFQARQSFPQFQAFVTQYPALSTYTSLTCSGVNVFSKPVGTHGTVYFTAVGPNNSLSFTLILVEQNGQWRVDNFTVP